MTTVPPPPPPPSMPPPPPPGMPPPGWQPGGYAGGGAEIPTYLWQSIVCTILCCLPFGVVGIVFASKVNALRAIGDIAGAQEASRKARMWTMISFGIGLTLLVIYIILIAAGAVHIRTTTSTNP
jgi:hypothetical protein